MKLAIITGASKGLGKSIAKEFLKEKIDVIGISRTDNEELHEFANEQRANYTFLSADLTLMDSLQSVISKLKSHIANQPIKTLYVINNAAIVHPIERAENVAAESVQLHYQINVVAPITILNELVSKATSENYQLIGVNITSGAAERPISGWSAYCSSKASINMYTKTVAVEQDEKNTGHKIIAFSPGIMDTAMQGEIRKSTDEQFSDVATFQAYKKQNKLSQPETVGHALVGILRQPSFLENGKIYYVSELQ